MAKAPPKAPTKTQIITSIAESTELSKKEVAAVFDALSDAISHEMGRSGSGQFTVPGLCKIVRKDVPAKPKRKGRNPSTQEEVWFPPKPASKKVVIRPLKGLKDMI
ncbi:DNA-binding protein HU 1 [Stieleria bergensis]|uniref:Viral histone-like protein n=1 Tax=Stieleria bergensis TaxID=2528025 RepID=A0A517T080_9BACT|nr:MAG: DNA-binding protein [Rhodopirellula sp. TMED11]QDT61799.1 DNA-binding protein HU 1 [Planctomycetes bacterium SV_7m_r]